VLAVTDGTGRLIYMSLSPTCKQRHKNLVGLLHDTLPRANWLSSAESGLSQMLTESCDDVNAAHSTQCGDTFVVQSRLYTRLTLPSFDTVCHNAKCTFRTRWLSCSNTMVSMLRACMLVTEKQHSQPDICHAKLEKLWTQAIAMDCAHCTVYQQTVQNTSLLHPAPETGSRKTISYSQIQMHVQEMGAGYCHHHKAWSQRSLDSLHDKLVPLRNVLCTAALHGGFTVTTAPRQT